MAIQRRKSWKVLLVGDHCHDVYHYGVCDRLSPEAPVPVLKQHHVETRLGMSSNVKLNLESFGIKVSHYRNANPIEKHRIIDTRFSQHLVRYDIGEEEPLTEMNMKLLKKPFADALVISDYNKGFISRNVAAELCEMYKGKPIFVDSKKKDLSCYNNCYIKINEKEFKSLSKMSLGADFIVTLGSSGALYNNKVYPTDKTEVFDVCGAGDVFLSTLVYAFLQTRSIEKSIPIANKAASYSVSKMGTYVMTTGDLKQLGIL